MLDALVTTMRSPRFIVSPAAAITSATAHRHHLLLGLVLAVAACGGRFSDDSAGSSGAGGTVAGSGGQGGATGGAGPGGSGGGSAGTGGANAGGANAGGANAGGTTSTGGGAGTGGIPHVGGAAGAGGSAGLGAAGGSAGAGGGSSGAGGQGGTNWTACGPTTTCVLESVGCCGPGCEPVPLSAFTAINQASVADYQKAHPVCPCVFLACLAIAPEQRNVPSYMATCVQGQCKAIDIRSSALTACTTSADCYLR
jgi:hypothetical protein